MKVLSYCTSGGKDLIKEFLDELSERESAEGYYIIEQLEIQGLEFLKTLNTRQLENKLWEIKYPRHNRIFYVVIDVETMYLLHACKKQKGKAEKFELDKARNRAKEII